MKKLLILAAIIGTLSGCQSGETAPVRSVALDEWSVSVGTGIATGPIELAITNDGEFPHTLVIASETGEVVAASDTIVAGSTATLAVDLEPGVYQFTCRIVAQTGDGRLVDHFEQGMVRSVTVGDTIADG